MALDGVGTILGDGTVGTTLAGAEALDGEAVLDGTIGAGEATVVGAGTIGVGTAGIDGTTGATVVGAGTTGVGMVSV